MPKSKLRPEEPSTKSKAVSRKAKVTTSISTSAKSQMPRTKSAPPKWLIMVYMAGDNPLNDEMATAMSDIKNNYRRLNNYKFTAYFDNGTPLFPTTLQEFVTPQAVTTRTNETDSANPLTIEEFIKWSIDKTKSYKADHYALIMSGHGDGFQNYSFMRDESPLGAMPITRTNLGGGVQDNLRKVLEKNLLPSGKKLEILGFDTCVMATFEVAYELRNTANIMIASQGYVPISGWSYAELISKLKTNEKNNTLDATNTAQAMMSAYMTYSRQYAKLVGRSANISSVELGNILYIKNSLNKLAGLLNIFPRSAGYPTTFKHIIERALLLTHVKAQSFLFEQCVDIMDFCNLLRSECDYFNQILTAPGEKTLIRLIKQECQATIGFIKAATIDCCFKGPDYQFGNGVSIFCPWSLTGFKMTEEKYQTFEFSAHLNAKKKFVAEPWTKFLKDFLKFNERPGNTQKGISGGVKVDPTSGKPRGDFSSQIDKFGKVKNFPLGWIDTP